MKNSAEIINSNKYIRLYSTNKKFRAEAGLYFGTAFNLLYALFYLTANIICKTVDFGIFGIYYAILFITRFFLLSNAKKIKEIKNSLVKKHYEWVVFKNCGIFLFALNIAISGMLWYRIFTIKNYKYPVIFLIISSGYTLYRFIVTVYKLSKKYTHCSVILSAAKRIDFCVSAMSVFALQTSVLYVFNINKIMAFIVNSISAFTVLSSVVYVALKMILYGEKQLKKSTVN